MKKYFLAGTALLAACAGSGSKKFDYCREMGKTDKEIADTEALNRDLKEKLDAVPQGTDSTESQRFAYVQAMDKNNEKIKDLKTYNEANAQNCRPAKAAQPPAPSAGY
jgi:hypothetical protein